MSVPGLAGPTIDKDKMNHLTALYDALHPVHKSQLYYRADLCHLPNHCVREGDCESTILRKTAGAKKGMENLRIYLEAREIESDKDAIDALEARGDIL